MDKLVRRFAALSPHDPRYADQGFSFPANRPSLNDQVAKDEGQVLPFDHVRRPISEHHPPDFERNNRIVPRPV